MKKTGFVLIFLLLIFSYSAALAESKLEYDFDYLFKWTASAMKIKIDSKKPRPVLKITPREELRRIYEERNGIKLVMEKDDEEIPLELSGFYEPSENAVYMQKEFDSFVGRTAEEFIVHELVHYFQNFYRPFDFDKRNDPCLKHPYWFWICPWEQQAYATERKFKVQHNLTITNDDLEHLND